MLPKRYRLHHRSDVQRVKRRGRRLRHPLAILLVSRTLVVSGEMPVISHISEQSPSRFAFVASRRVGSAVARNRSKRMLREAVRSQVGIVQPGWDGVFIARKATVQASLPDVEKAVIALLMRAKILLSN